MPVEVNAVACLSFFFFLVVRTPKTITVGILQPPAGHSLCESKPSRRPLRIAYSNILSHTAIDRGVACTHDVYASGDSSLCECFMSILRSRCGVANDRDTYFRSCGRGSLYV